MFQIIVLLQYIGIALLLFEIFYIADNWTSRPKTFLLLFAIAALVNNVGYLFEITATTPETAIMGTRFSYLGKAFIPLLMTLFTLQYCKVHISKWVVRFLMVIHTVVLFLVLMSDYNTLYYSSIGYNYDGKLFPHLVLGHGIVYKCYTVLLMGYMIYIPIIIIYCWFKFKERNDRRQLWYLLCMVIVTEIGYFAFILKLTEGYDTTALSYIISTIFLLYGMFHDKLFDAITVAKDYVIENLDDGLVVLDHHDALAFYNNLALKLFPELAQDKGRNAIKIIKSYSDNREELFFEDKVYSITEKPIVKGDKLGGSMFSLLDITDSYNYTSRLEADVEAKTSEVKHIQRSVIASFANMIEARDGVTGLHIKNTSAYVEIIVNELRKRAEYSKLVDSNMATVIVDAAPLHDIGKISVLDSILTKPGKLTPEEFELIKQHAVVGAKIIDETLSEVENNEYLRVAKDMAQYHHERWDGTGYPQGLKGEEIPLSARIMAIADVYDALRSKRSYKEAFSIEKSMEIMRESSGTHFDPVLLEIFLENVVKIDRED